MSQEPMIKLEPGGTAPILSYNVPEPTSYTGRHVIELELPQEWFNDAARQIPSSLSSQPNVPSRPTVPVIVLPGEPRRTMERVLGEGPPTPGTIAGAGAIARSIIAE